MSSEIDQIHPEMSPSKSKKCEIPLDLFFFLVGGASIDTIKAKLQGKALKSGSTPEKIIQFLINKDLFFYHQNDKSGKFAVEVLYIKMLTFLDLLNKVSRFHPSKQGARLNLSPDRIVVSMHPSDMPLPLIWNFFIKLQHSGNQSSETVDDKVVANQVTQFESADGNEPSSAEIEPSLKITGTGQTSIFYSLGKIFLNALLVNDWNTPEETAGKINKMMTTINEIESKPPMDPETVRNFILEEISRAEEVFGSSNILYHETDRMKTEGMVPEEIWDEIIVFVIDLLKTEDRSEFTEDEPAPSRKWMTDSFNSAIKQLSDLSKSIKIELFHRHSMEKEICDVLDGCLATDGTEK